MRKNFGPPPWVRWYWHRPHGPNGRQKSGGGLPDGCPALFSRHCQRDYAKATGFEIDFRRFNSGADIFAAIASGDVQIGYIDSSPYAAATSRGLDVKAFYVASIYLPPCPRF